MPTYSVLCSECGHIEDKKMTFSDYDRIKEGLLLLECPQCTCGMELNFDPGAVTFVLKDGPSGGWASKAVKENTYRAKHRLDVEKKERDHVFKNKLIPNITGQETGTWREAQAAAGAEGKDTSTYNSFVAQDH